MPIHYGKMAQRELGHILGRELGWENKMVRVENKLVRMWCRPVEVADVEADDMPFLS